MERKLSYISNKMQNLKTSNTKVMFRHKTNIYKVQ